MRDDKKRVDPTFVVGQSAFVTDEAEFLATVRKMYNDINQTFSAHRREPALVELHVYAAPKKG